MSRKNQETYSIGDTAKITGATQKQIRNWEARGYIPEAGRVISGVRAYRRFTLEQIEIIGNIKLYLGQGFTLPVAVKKANEGGKKNV
ncbi:MAG: MerR family transcriptional regulator [Desulfobacterales bacterium]|jgi:DNA-binding transcriptional MerR regulator|nr:MerR family transcriptional regulator [Desulfobacterales bacterium]